MFMMRLVLSVLGYFGLIVFAYIFWNNVPQRLFGAPLAGIVVDRATGKPIPGAYVSYLWESATDPKGFFGSGGRDICYHAAGTTADAAGRFHVDGWSEWSTYRVTNQDPQALVYAPGYEATTFILHEGSFEPPIPRLRERYALRSFSGTNEQRIKNLFWGFANRGCDYGKESKKSLYPMMRAVYFEIRPLASTPSEHEIAESVAGLTATTALAIDPNGPVQVERERTFIEENLK
ncbi:MAG: hypothetical protein JSS46_13300 [Proteobacteria bacterium]|jgi:hypothetical protein|nr:hypothetical protein [Pseudomonadota bacterium]